MTRNATQNDSNKISCRFCGHRDLFLFLQLGEMALANRFLTEAEVKRADEKTYPMDVYYCEPCGLVQIGYAVPPDILFKDYIYFSSTSDAVHKHADYLAKSFHKRFDLHEKSRVVEIASNDGCVLEYFKKIGVWTLGVEPAVNIARIASQKGIETVNEFFNEKTAGIIKTKYGPADVILARHVFAHVPEIHDFVKGLARLLAPGGAVAIEAPYLIDFIEKTEFDTVYHEHYSYLSVRPISKLFSMYDMELFDVEPAAIHGGSLIYFIGHRGAHPVHSRVSEWIRAEIEKKLDKKETYIRFAKRAAATKEKLRQLLLGLKAEGKRIAAYGAPAKGNTLLNYCGIKADLVEYTVDRSPYKQNLYTPGTHLPVRHPNVLVKEMPDYVLLLAWNFADEIFEQQAEYRRRGGRFIIPIPDVEVV